MEKFATEFFGDFQIIHRKYRLLENWQKDYFAGTVQVAVIIISQGKLRCSKLWS